MQAGELWSLPGRRLTRCTFCLAEPSPAFPALACRRMADRRPRQAASQRPAASQKVAASAPAAAPSVPIITEVDSEGEAEPAQAPPQAGEEPAPAHPQRAATAAAAAPVGAAVHSDGDSEGEGRQVRIES